MLFFDSFHNSKTKRSQSCLKRMDLKLLAEQDIDRIIEMAWEDRTPFDAILLQFGLKEAEVIALMRREMKPSSWRMWRARVQGRATKHSALRGFEVGRHKCNLQRNITGNKISKR
jgi:uncharacterized protein (TIGR03643 family)